MKLRDHQIEESVKSVTGWIYSDTKEPCSFVRECGFCGLNNTPEGHDGCIGTLPDVMNACCGHGRAGEAYVQFWDGSRLAGQEALTHIRRPISEDLVSLLPKELRHLVEE